MRERLPAQTTVEFSSPDNADNFARGVHPAHVFANRVFVGEMAALKRFVNDSDQRRPFDIAIIEKAPGAQWNSQDPKVIFAHLVVRGLGSPLFRDRWMLFDSEIPRRTKAVDNTCSLYA